MTLKVRIVLFSTFNSKTTERPKIFLWPFSYFFSLAYWPLNSAAGRKKTLVTLLEVLQLTGGSQEGRCICKNQWGILATAVCHACINLHFSMHLQLVILCYVLLLKKTLKEQVISGLYLYWKWISGTVESWVKKAWFKKESRFKKDCCSNQFFST